MTKAGFLKQIVVVLALAIFVALFFVVYGVVNLATKEEPAVATPKSDIERPLQFNLKQPEGSEIVSVAEMTGGFLAVAVRGGGGDRVLVVDPRTGDVRQTILLTQPDDGAP